MEEHGVRLLADIRNAFNPAGVDFMFSKTLTDALNELDDAPWLGTARHQRHPSAAPPVGERTRVTATALWHPAAHGRAVSLGPLQQRGGSGRGYRRDQFTCAWVAYCRSDDTHADTPAGHTDNPGAAFANAT